jgi:hypothetical protein
MAPTDLEFGILSADVETLKGDVAELKTDMKKVLACLTREEGAKEERDRIGTNESRKLELTWTKLGALGCFIGAVTGAVMLAPHFFLHLTP